ncbi:MAG: SusC/RagA family TonB-linked outer membrane protein, partial [Bacteroidota bacterium]
SLAEESALLNEVVVVGYGTQRKSESTAAVTTIDSAAIANLAVTDVRQGLAGRVPGAQFLNNSGVPGAGVRVIIRGTGSFTNTEPLYVIDGIQGGDINAVNPADIETFTVLKDASATAIYGVAAANGVVIITTKRGQSGKPRISYSGYVGSASPSNRLDLLNASQYVELVRDIADATGSTLPSKFSTNEVTQDVTDWQDVMFQSAPVTEHNIRLEGGGAAFNYYASGQYASQGSTVIDQDWRRGLFSVCLTEKVGRFRFTQDLRSKFTNTTGLVASFIDGLRMPPYAPVEDPNNLGGFSKVTTIDDLNDAFNPLTNVRNSDRESNDLSLNLDLTAEWEIIDGLSIKSQARLSSFNGQYNQFDLPRANGNLVFDRSITERYYTGYNFILENFLNFKRLIGGDHSIGITLGNTYAPAGKFRQVQLNGGDIPNNEIRQIGVANTATISNAFANSGRAGLSYFGRVNYTYKDRYVLSASFRRDGSSVFGEDNRWGNFPGIGVAWNVSEEPFFENNSLFSSLKIKANYGKTGNNNIGAFLNQSNVFRGSSGNILYSFGDGTDFAFGSTINTPSNPFIQWEETSMYDVGFEAGLFDDRLNVTFDYYYRDSEGLLTALEKFGSSGFGSAGSPGFVTENAASALNRGIELGLGFSNNAGDLSYSIGANISYNYNETTSLGGEDVSPRSAGGFAGVSAITRTEPGNPIGAFYGFVVDRVASTQAEVDALNAGTGDAEVPYQANFMVGDIIFQDLDGNGFIDENDQRFLGDPIPDYLYGGYIDLGYKGFDLSASFSGVAGVEVVNALDYWLEGMTRPFNSNTDVLDRWRQEGDVARLPRAGQNANGGANLRPSTRYIENGAYFRLRNLTLGYSLPIDNLSNLTNGAVSKLRLYITGQNILTITDYSGYDPEISSNGDFIFARGIDFGRIPTPRTILFGVQVGF